ncbi:hypothetical protein [Natronolimnohabitans sp. A-GB9]|uniref:hypothetical protein n=1 Tax=Natronolimnohabitans sp. A-GB9 TaxID=3069757 RepID=UPI0031F33168
MTDPTDRFVLEIGHGTVAHVIDTAADADQTESNARLSLGSTAPGKKMCTRGNRSFRAQQVSFSTFVDQHDLEKTGFEGDAPDEICSYCWSNTRDALERDSADEETADRIGTVGYRLRWKQKGRAREEWYDVVVRPETTMAELDRLVCQFTTLDDLHLRLYGLEDEYLDSSLNVLPDHQYAQAGHRSYTKASEVTIADVAERAGLRRGDRLSLVYDFGTPSRYYCIVKEIYDPDEIDELLADSDVIVSTDTAAIVRVKRP